MVCVIGAYKLKSLRAHVFVSQCLCNQQNYKPAFFWICGDESQAGLQQVEKLTTLLLRWKNLKNV